MARKNRQRFAKGKPHKTPKPELPVQKNGMVQTDCRRRAIEEQGIKKWS